MSCTAAKLSNWMRQELAPTIGLFPKPDSPFIMPDESLNESAIVLCPGQGAQYVGMGKDWCDRDMRAAKIFERAGELLDFDLSLLCFEGPEQSLNRTDNAQVAIYVASVACFAALVHAGSIGTIEYAAGLSLGEFTALHVAGAFDFESGLRLVRLRGQAMQEAAEAVPGGSGMVALIGADEDQADQLCDRVNGDLSREGQDGADLLVPANFNCPGQVVISGHQVACHRALEVSQEMGMRAKALAVVGAFHSPLMKPAADRLAKALDQTQWQLPRIPVLSNVTGQPHDTDIDSIKRRLVGQLTQPVRWTDSMCWLSKNAHGQFVELAPGKVLAGLMRRIDRAKKVKNFDRSP